MKRARARNYARHAAPRRRELPVDRGGISSGTAPGRLVTSTLLVHPRHCMCRLDYRSSTAVLQVGVNVITVLPLCFQFQNICVQATRHISHRVPVMQGSENHGFSTFCDLRQQPVESPMENMDSSSSSFACSSFHGCFSCDRSV